MLFINWQLLTQVWHCTQVIDEADRVMEEIKQDWLSLVDKAVYHEQSATDSHIYLSTCQRLAPGPLTLDKYVDAVVLCLF